MRLGAHVSIAGGLAQAIDRGVALGAECLQIFVSSPRSWHPAGHDAGAVARFRQRQAEAAIAPVFIHTIYLLNLASPEPALYARSMESLTLALSWAERLGAQGVITHLGSGIGRGDDEAEAAVAHALRVALRDAPGSAQLLLETAAGRTLGHSFAQLGRVMRRLDNHPRLAICLDTAHVFAAGYDFTSARGCKAMLAEFEQAVGLDRLAAIHANDSKHPLASGRDQHENIGHGCIGERAFARLLRQPALRRLPFILEVPGLQGTGPDRDNLAVLRRLAGRKP